VIICGRYGRDVEREGNIHVLDEWIEEGGREREEEGEGRKGEEEGERVEGGREGEGKREGTC